MTRKTVNYAGVFDLTRPGPTYEFDAAGNLAETPAGLPAFEFDPVTGEALGQRIISYPLVNAFRYSDGLAGWSQINATIENGSVPSFGGNGNASQILMADSTELQHGAQAYNYVGRNTAQTVYVIVRPVGRARIGFRRKAADGSDMVVFDFETVSVYQNGSDYTDGTIKQLPDGYFLISYHLEANTTTTAYWPVMCILDPDFTGTYKGYNADWQTDGTQGLEVFYTASLPEGSAFAYVPTDGSSETRVADDLRIPLTNLSWWPGPFTVYLELERFLQQATMFIFAGGSARRLAYTTSAHGPVSVYDGSSVVNTGENAPDAGIIKIAVSVDFDKKAIASNGVGDEGAHNGVFISSDISEWVIGSGVYAGNDFLVRESRIERGARSLADLKEMTS